MLKFKSRSLARVFASKTGRKVVDLGAAANGSRLAVKIK